MKGAKRFSSLKDISASPLPKKFSFFIRFVDLLFENCTIGIILITINFIVITVTQLSIAGKKFLSLIGLVGRTILIIFITIFIRNILLVKIFIIFVITVIVIVPVAGGIIFIIVV